MTHVLGVKPVKISFCLKKPPGLMSADRVSLYEPLKAIREREEKERNVRQTVYIYKMDRGRRRTQSPALGIESSETGGVPRVRLESVIRRISQAVRSTS